MCADCPAVLRALALVLNTLVLVACGVEQRIVVPLTPARTPLEPNGEASYELWVFNAKTRSGAPTACATLLDRTLVPTDPDLVIVAGPVRGVLGEGATLKDIPVGERVFFVDVFAQPDELGPRLAAGCKDGIVIDGRSKLTLDLETVAN